MVEIYLVTYLHVKVMKNDDIFSFAQSVVVSTSFFLCVKMPKPREGKENVENSFINRKPHQRIPLSGAATA